MKTAGRFTPSRGFESHTLRDATTRSRTRLRPLLVVLACVVCLPAAVLAGPGGGPDRPMIAAMVVLVIASVVGRLEGARGDAERRERIGVAITSATALVLVLLAARSSLPGAAWLAAFAATAVAMATIRRPAVRTTVQAALVLGAGSVLLADQPDPWSQAGALAVLGPLVLVIAITALASALAADLALARNRELATRRAAERRAELLEAVRQLSHAGPGQLVDATVEALHDLGFPVAGVLLLEGDRLRPRRVDGVGHRDDYDEGVSEHALTTGRTVVSSDYRNDELRLPGLDLGAVVATPIVADGRRLGVLMVGLHEAGTPPMGDIEVVEVLAAHLGGALANQRVVANQDALLARLRDLDGLRASFVDRVSEDLRDPLTVVRGVAQTLATHGDRLPDTQRRAMLGRLTAQATDLTATLETLLDFSRVHVGRVEPAPEPVDLLELLSPPLAGTGIGVHVDGRPEVLVDRELVQRAIELLRRGTLDRSAGLRATVVGDDVAVDVRLRDLGALQGGFARTIAEQLLVAGGARSERLADGLRLLLPRAPGGAS